MTYWAFDLDGTILDCRRRQVALMSELVSTKLGIDLDHDAYWAKKRDGFPNDKALIEAGIPEAMSGPLCTAWLEVIENDEWLLLDEPLEGATDALHAARDREIDLVIVTARGRPDGVYKTLKRLDIESLISHVCVVAPNSRVGAKKAQCLSRYSAELFFGDSESDLDSAQRAGVPFAGVECGQRSARFLNNLGATTFSTLQSAVANALQRKF